MRKQKAETVLSDITIGQNYAAWGYVLLIEYVLIGKHCLKPF